MDVVYKNAETQVTYDFTHVILILGTFSCPNRSDMSSGAHPKLIR